MRMTSTGRVLTLVTVAPDLAPAQPAPHQLSRRLRHDALKARTRGEPHVRISVQMAEYCADMLAELAPKAHPSHLSVPPFGGLGA